MALTKYCRCGKQIPIRQKCCEECIGYYQKQMSKYQKKYDRSKRVNAEFYHSSEWITLRQMVLSKANGLDLYEYYINHKITRADTVHHIVEIREDNARALDITNLIPLSSSNHRKIHKMYFKKKKETQEILFNILKQAKCDGIG